MEDSGGPSGLDLSPPVAVKAIGPEQAEQAITVPPDVAARIDAMVETYVADAARLDPHGADYRRRIAEIGSIAEREIVATSELSNRLLGRPVHTLSGVLDGRGPIARHLADLRRAIDGLSPAGYDLSDTRPRKLLGLIPRGDPLQRYFERYAKAQAHLEAIIRALTDSRNGLQADNAAIGQEQSALWTEMETLRQYAYLARTLDQALERQIDALAAPDLASSRTLRQDVLFPVRQRLQDILLQLAVASQGYAALRVVQENNDQLIRAIGTATTATMAALRTAVMVAQALTQRRIVLDRLGFVNALASGMVEGSSTIARSGAADPGAGPAVPARDLASLEGAWNEVLATLDQIARYRSASLQAMGVTVRELTDQVGRSRDDAGRIVAAEGAAARAERADPPSLRLA